MLASDSSMESRSGGRSRLYRSPPTGQDEPNPLRTLWHGGGFLVGCGRPDGQRKSSAWSFAHWANVRPRRPVTSSTVGDTQALPSR